MRYLHLTFLVFLFAFLFAGCKKEDKSPTKTDLIARTWQVNKVSGNVSGFQIIIYEKGKSDNAQDFSNFRMTFEKNGNVSIISNDGEKLTGKWAFKENETKLEISGEETTLFNLLQLTSGNLDIASKDDESGAIVTFFLIPL
jgi:hypothetical protein